jgi:hypothetical protein
LQTDAVIAALFKPTSTASGADGSPRDRQADNPANDVAFCRIVVYCDSATEVLDRQRDERLRGLSEEAIFAHSTTTLSINGRLSSAWT